METIKFSKEALLEIRDQQLATFDWAYKNLLKAEKGSGSFWKWAEYCLHAVRQVFELEDQAENAESELDNEN